MNMLTVSALCFGFMTVHARAQIPVTDAALNLQSLKSYFQQAIQIKHEIQTDLNTANMYAQEIQTYLSFVNNPSLSAAMGLINRTGLGSDLPVDPREVASLASGYASMTSGGRGITSLAGGLARLRMIAGYAGSSYSANHVYNCDGADPVCADMNARANGIAGSMGLTQAAYANVAAHVEVIQGLRDDLAGTTDPAKRETILAQLAAEQGWLNSMQTSLAAASQQAALQQQAMSQRNAERQRQSADQLAASTQPMTGLLPSPPVPPLFASN